MDSLIAEAQQIYHILQAIRPKIREKTDDHFRAEGLEKKHSPVYTVFYTLF